MFSFHWRHGKQSDRLTLICPRKRLETVFKKDSACKRRRLNHAGSSYLGLPRGGRPAFFLCAEDRPEEEPKRSGGPRRPKGRVGNLEDGSGRNGGGREGDTRALHGGARPEVPRVDAGSCSPRCHRLWATLSRRGVSNAAILDTRSPQYAKLSLSLCVSLSLYDWLVVLPYLGYAIAWQSYFWDWLKVRFDLDTLIKIGCTYSESLEIVFAEQTFIIVDKDLVEGEFTRGDPHVEG